MNSTSMNGTLRGLAWVLGVAVLACFPAPDVVAAQETAAKTTPAAIGIPQGVRTFDSPQQAGDALASAAEQFDQSALVQIFGPEGKDLVFSGEVAQDRQRAADFAAEAREKKRIAVSPKNEGRAFLLVGNEDWPFPVPIVKRANKWFFDTKAGRQEILNRRVGSNELDAIQICRGYVEAQQQYALLPRKGYDVNQYAQTIISNPGKQDGLAWQNADGTWGGPIGEKAAEAIQDGYSRGEPYHGYFFKVLKGQGPAAPMGQLDYVINGAMIGGFALVAAPSDYRVTGVKTFIVSNDGVVYEKDLGPTTLDQFKKMERFNPDKSWAPVFEDVD